MTEQELLEIQKRVENATAGEWLNSWYGTVRVIRGEEEVLEVCDCWLEQELADAEFIANAKQDVPNLIGELVKLRAENERLELEVQTSDKLAIEKMREAESYKELYELCADHMTELQRKLDIVELAEAKARMSEEKYTAVALSDTFNQFKTQQKIDKLVNALDFYATTLTYNEGRLARQTLEVVLDEKN